MLARRHEVTEALELVTSHRSAPLNCLILLKMHIEVFFEGEVAHESHSTDAAVEFHALEYLCLGRFREPVIQT